MSQIVAETVRFNELCSLCERVSSVSGNDKKRKLVEEFFSHWRGRHAKIHGAGKVVNLAKAYIDIIGLGKDSHDALRLLNYKAPRTARANAGDFASVVYFVLKNRCIDEGTLSIADVNQYLDQVANGSAKKDKAMVKHALQHLLRKTTASEQKWIVRMILKELKLGLSETSVLRVFHKDGEELFNVCNNLKKVCQDLHDPNVRIEGADITLFSAFKPMLAGRPKIQQVVELMNNHPFYVETKYDGDRIQLHKDGDVYAYFSRNAKDYTSAFGEGPTMGSFTPYIHECFSKGIKSCILDGEMVAYHPEKKCFVAKGKNVDVKSIGFSGGGTAADGSQQCFVVFDVVMINGKSLTSSPLKERIVQLRKLFQEVPGRMLLSKPTVMSTKEELVSSLNDAIDNLEEGLMAKDPESVYKPDKRNGSGWLKIKPEYVDSLSDQLDVVIIGGYFGKGRRGGCTSHFMLGVAVKEDISSHPTKFYSFCKVGSGYSHKELFELNRQLEPHWRTFDTSNPPSCIELASGFKEKPDVYIDPSKSKIVQIRAAEILPSEKFATGCTLRFPRVDSIRDDKEWYDCMTIDDLQALRSTSGGRLISRHLDSDADDESPRKKRRTVVRTERPRAVALHFQAFDMSDVTAVSRLFSGLEFYVVNGPKDLPKTAVEKLIAEHGGSFTQSPSDKTHCVLADHMVARVRSVISMGIYDVVRVEWLQECLSAKKLLDLLPHHMIHASHSTAERFASLFDKYDDSYTEDITENGIRRTFITIGEKHGDVSVTQAEMIETEQRYMGDWPIVGLFRGSRFYVDRFAEVGRPETLVKNSPLDLTRLTLRFYGGLVANEIDENISHVVLHESDLQRLGEFQQLRRGLKRKFYCVTEKWVEESISQGALQTELAFAPRLNA